MNKVKRVLAIVALVFAAAFILMTLFYLVTGQMQTKGTLIMIPLSAFLGLGLIVLAINYLQKLKAEKLKEAQQELEKRK